MTMLVSKMPRHTGMQWKLLKLHHMLHHVPDATRYGCPCNWDSEIPEHNHLHMAKAPGRRAHKNHATFERQVAQRLSDTHIIESMNRLIHPHNEIAHNDHASLDSNIGYAAGTKCMIQKLQPGNIAMTWYTKSDTSTFAVIPGMPLYVCDYFNKQQIIIQTEYKRHDMQLRCHPNYQAGGPQYDWVHLVCARNTYCPAQVFAVVLAEDNNIPETMLIVKPGKQHNGVKSTLFTEWEMEDHFEAVEVDTIDSTCMVVHLDKNCQNVAVCLDYKE